jgi:hypothetical protein
MNIARPYGSLQKSALLLFCLTLKMLGTAAQRVEPVSEPSDPVSFEVRLGPTRL